MENGVNEMTKFLAHRQGGAELSGSEKGQSDADEGTSASSVFRNRIKR